MQQRMTTTVEARPGTVERILRVAMQQLERSQPGDWVEDGDLRHLRVRIEIDEVPALERVS